MRAAVVEVPGRLAVKDVERPSAEGRALVRIDQAGVCGTDLKILVGAIGVATPLVLGHEMTGRVELAGERGDFAPGTRVLINPVMSCGACDLCRRDLPHLCRNGGLLGRDADGGFAEYAAVDESSLHEIPKSVSDDEAAVLQVLSTCVHAQSGLRVAAGASAVVVGLGVAGLLHTQLLRARGVSTIIGVTRSEWKRELALRSGATHVVAPEEAADAVAAATGGRGADVAIECAGTEETLIQSMHLAGAGGTVVVFGITTPAADGLPTYQWYFKELTIVSPRAARPRDCDLAIRLCAERRLDLAPLVTARFPLTATAAALAACGDPDQLKIVLDISLWLLLRRRETLG